MSDTVKQPWTALKLEAVADLLRSRLHVRSAVRGVLLEGSTNKDAAGANGLSPQALSNAVRRYRIAFDRIQKAFGRQ